MHNKTSRHPKGTQFLNENTTCWSAKVNKTAFSRTKKVNCRKTSHIGTTSLKSLQAKILEEIFSELCENCIYIEKKDVQKSQTHTSREFHGFCRVHGLIKVLSLKGLYSLHVQKTMTLKNSKEF